MPKELNIIKPDLPIIIGESPIWDPSSEQVYWVDIEGKKLLSTNINSHQTRYFDMPQRIGNAVFTTTGDMLLSLQDGLYRFALDTQQLKKIITLEPNKPNNRPNDGKCDPAGRFWIGTMDLQFQKGASSLYRIDVNGHSNTMLDNLTLANGMAWNEERSLFYFIDSDARAIFCFDYDLNSGNIKNKKVVIEFDTTYGIPDGMCIDREGMLWVAGFGGGNVIRFDPTSGKMLERVSVPAPHTTSVCFAGKQLNELVITTATLMLSEDDLKKYPKSGCLFSFSCDTPGYAAVPYKSDY